MSARLTRTNSGRLNFKWPEIIASHSLLFGAATILAVGCQEETPKLEGLLSVASNQRLSPVSGPQESSPFAILEANDEVPAHTGTASSEVDYEPDETPHEPLQQETDNVAEANQPSHEPPVPAEVESNVDSPASQALRCWWAPKFKVLSNNVSGNTAEP